MTGPDHEYMPQIATLDADWVNLMMIARALGVSKEKVKEFLEGKVKSRSAE
jgi:hypothetical protein